LLLTEVLGGGFSQPPDLAKENQILALLDNPNIITLVQVTRQVAMQAREFRQRFHIKSPDAIHLATAVFIGADSFMTTDEDDFPIGETVDGVRILVPHSALGADILPPS
jgi:predicted nucleic acid-binding protein